MDVSDGIAYTRTLKEMEDNFKRLHPDNEENKPIMINFVLSQFLDGVQILKKKILETRPRDVPYFFDYMQGKFWR